jgi:hypothetical protein
LPRSASTCRATGSLAAPCTMPGTGCTPPTRGGTGGRSRSPRARQAASLRRGSGAFVGELCGEDEVSSCMDEVISARMSGEHQWHRGEGFIAAVSGGPACVPCIYAIPCSKVTPRCAAAQTAAVVVIRRGRRDDGRVETTKRRFSRLQWITGESRAQPADTSQTYL